MICSLLHQSFSYCKLNLIHEKDKKLSETRNQDGGWQKVQGSKEVTSNKLYNVFYIVH